MKLIKALELLAKFDFWSKICGKLIKPTETLTVLLIIKCPLTPCPNISLLKRL